MEWEEEIAGSGGRFTWKEKMGGGSGGGEMKVVVVGKVGDRMWVVGEIGAREKVV